MAIQLVTLSNDLYKDSRARLIASAAAHGILNAIPFDFEYVKNSQFYEENEAILSHKRFMGYWLWKPFILLEAIKKLDDNDILIYVDAGAEIIDSLEPLIDICKHESDIIICGNANDLNVAWTKRDCFVYMDCDSPRYWYASHCDASFAMFRKTARSVDFITQWLEYSKNANILTDLPNVSGLPNLPEYIDHRYDQSVLSILAEKFEVPLRRMPSQFGNHYKARLYRVAGEINCVNQSYQKELDYYYFLPYHNSPYGQLLNHHRKKNQNAANATPVANVVLPSSNYSFIRRVVKRCYRLIGGG